MYMLGAYVGDAATHRAGADDGDLLEVHESEKLVLESYNSG